MGLKAKIEGNKLMIEIEMNPNPTPSKSGKTLVVASTHGNQATDVMVGGKQVTVGLNAYIYNN